jgi:hypothetical protein
MLHKAFLLFPLLLAALSLPVFGNPVQLVGKVATSLVRICWLILHPRPIDPTSICQGSKIITSTKFIGKEKNVKMEQITCDALDSSEVIDNGAVLQARQASNPNVCGANCMFNSFALYENRRIFIIEDT